MRTRTLYAGALIMLWALLRNRYDCPKSICVLVLLAMFPEMDPYRPDLTAVALSIAAWLALPQELSWRRIVMPGCLAGATVLVSPAFGTAITSSLLLLVLLNREQSLGLVCAARWFDWEPPE